MTQTKLENTNQLQTNEFGLVIEKIPNATFFARELSIPGLNLPPVSYPNPLVVMPIPGDHIDFEQFSFTFAVDEDLVNYKELFKWIRSLGFPSSFNDYSGKISDGTVMLVTNKKNVNPKGIITFTDMWPTNLSSIQISRVDSQPSYAFCVATFAYTQFDFID